jgi:molybdopterin converting factor small subunit
MGRNTIEVKVDVEGVILGRKIKEKFVVCVKKGGTLKDLLKALDRCNRLGKRFFRDLPTLIDLPELEINGEKCSFLKDLKKKLKDGDHIYIYTNSKCH